MGYRSYKGPVETLERAMGGSRAGHHLSGLFAFPAHVGLAHLSLAGRKSRLRHGPEKARARFLLQKLPPQRHRHPDAFGALVLIMCGKFTAMASWAEVVAFSKPLTADRADPDGDRQITFRVMDVLPLHVWDKELNQRRILGARWGFPSPTDWRRPQPIHARSKSIDTTKVFAGAFLDGQRGVVLVKTFNEAPDSCVQHTITPQASVSGIAFLWRKFEVGTPAPLYACVMVTVPANPLIASLPTDRMPAILDAKDWSKWTGEEPASVDELKAMLKTAPGVNWKMAREQRGKATMRESTGTLF